MVGVARRAHEEPGRDAAPISVTLATLLATRRLDPNGDPLPPTAHVFGNEVGERIDSVKSAWRGTCRRAGIVDLSFHDLRRTAGSRFLQDGVPLHDVRDQLGHASVHRPTPT